MALLRSQTIDKKAVDRQKLPYKDRQEEQSFRAIETRYAILDYEAYTPLRTIRYSLPTRDRMKSYDHMTTDGTTNLERPHRARADQCSSVWWRSSSSRFYSHSQRSRYPYRTCSQYWGLRAGRYEDRVPEYPPS